MEASFEGIAGLFKRHPMLIVLALGIGLLVGYLLIKRKGSSAQISPDYGAPTGISSLPASAIASGAPAVGTAAPGLGGGYGTYAPTTSTQETSVYADSHNSSISDMHNQSAVTSSVIDMLSNYAPSFVSNINDSFNNPASPLGPIGGGGFMGSAGSAPAGAPIPPSVSGAVPAIPMAFLNGKQVPLAQAQAQGVATEPGYYVQARPGNYAANQSDSMGLFPGLGGGSVRQAR